MAHMLEEELTEDPSINSTTSNPPIILDRDSPTASLSTRSVGAGHCDQPGKDNDVKGDVVTCQCLHINETTAWDDAMGGPPGPDFAKWVKDNGCGRLSNYTWFDNGGATAVTYGLRNEDYGTAGIMRGMARLEFNGGANECDDDELRVVMSNDDCLAAMDTITKDW